MLFSANDKVGVSAINLLKSHMHEARAVIVGGEPQQHSLLLLTFIILEEDLELVELARACVDVCGRGMKLRCLHRLQGNRGQRFLRGRLIRRGHGR